jgi:hypothetical protein
LKVHHTPIPSVCHVKMDLHTLTACPLNPAFRARLATTL